MKKHFNNFLFSTLLITTGMVGCKKDLDINRNPNAVTESNITAELILPNALHGVGAQTAGGYGWLANWMGYWSPSGTYNPSTEESTYNITNTFQEPKWTGIYNVLFDLDNAEKRAEATNQSFYRSMAMIMKAHLFQNLVDLYGNVPYSQAFKPLEFPTPAFDKAEDIYADLQVRLDTAINLLKTAEVTTKAAEEVDIVYHGDAELWTKLANTLKLRLLIRQSEVNPNPTAELAKITANGGVLMSGESAAVNPGYINDVGKQSPFYSVYGLTPAGNEANEYYRANAYAIEKLVNSGDPRLGYFFEPAKNTPGTFKGTVYGSNPDVAFSGDLTSNIGPGLVKSFDQPQWIVTSVESMFLYAEAVARGWFAGDEKAAYEAAVTESFLWLSLDDADAETMEEAAAEYLAQANIAKWENAGTSMQSKVNFIVHQKYIALTGINPLEAWNDYRRLGVPADVPLSVNAARGSRTIPVRLLYPLSESAVNAANVQVQGDMTPQSKIFWDK
jgi:hypothetical protein